MIAEISVVPIGVGIDLARYVAGIIKVIDESGLEYKLNAMGTVIEGEREQVFDLIKKCHTTMLQSSDRVLTTVKIDDRKDKTGSMIEQKIQAVENEIGKTVKK